MRKTIFFLTFIFSASVFAQAKPETKTKPKTVNVSRHTLGLDYNSWYQNFVVETAGSLTESQGLIYGMGLSYFYSKYYLSWGWGGELGYIQAIGVVGNSANTTQYYARRVPVDVVRVGGRAFLRYNPQLDLGASASFLLGKPAWPEKEGFTIKSNSSYAMGLFIDTRWRLSKDWELVQAIGAYSRSRNAAWRFGLTYSF